MKSRLPEGQYEVKVKVHDVIWKHEVVSTVTVVVKYIDDVAIANAGSLRIQGDGRLLTSVKRKHNKLSIKTNFVYENHPFHQSSPH